MRKTLVITNFFPPEYGGIQNYVYNLVSRLPQDDVFVLTDKKNDSLSFDSQQNFKIIRKSFTSPLRHLKLTSLDLFFKVRKIVDQYNIDLLIAGHFYLPALTCYLLNKTRGIPYHIFTYGTEITELRNSSDTKKKYMHNIFTHADKVYTISDYLKNILIENKVDKDKIVKIYPGVDHNTFTPLDVFQSRQYLAKKLDIDLTGYNVILSLGRLVKRKGQDMMIKALPEILIKYPKTKYIIVGDGPDREYLKGIVTKYNVNKYVIFAGAPSDKDVLYYYNACDIFAMPSRTIENSQDVEGFGIVYLEAAACHKPVIAGSGGGVSEAVDNGKTGLLIDPQSQNEISDVILKLMTDPYYAQKLGENGRQRVINNFDWDKIVDNFKSYLE